MSVSPQAIYRRYVWASAMAQDADAVAQMFAEDGMIEAPLAAVGGLFPRRMQGRSAIRAGLTEFYERSANALGEVKVDDSRYLLHSTADPAVFIAEVDTVFVRGGRDTTMSLVQIFRLRDGEIALLRDYFASELLQ